MKEVNSTHICQLLSVEPFQSQVSNIHFVSAAFIIVFSQLISQVFLQHQPSAPIVQMRKLRASWGLNGKESACQCRRCRYDPWLGKIPWRRRGNTVFFPGKPHGQRSLVGYSPRGRKEWDTTTTQQQQT